MPGRKCEIVLVLSVSILVTQLKPGHLVCHQDRYAARWKKDSICSPCRFTSSKMPDMVEVASEFAFAPARRCTDMYEALVLDFLCEDPADLTGRLDFWTDPLFSKLLEQSEMAEAIGSQK
eukprot:jgi/Botrbrau1/15438/Bobra.43_2s0063.1